MPADHQREAERGEAPVLPVEIGEAGEEAEAQSGARDGIGVDPQPDRRWKQPSGDWMDEEPVGQWFDFDRACRLHGSVTLRTTFPAGKPERRRLRTAAMGFIALLMAGESLPGEQPSGLGQVGGISLLERQVRMALKAGAKAVWLVAPALPSDLAARLSDDPRLWRVPTAEALGERLAGETRSVLHLAPGLLIDERLVSHLVTDRAAPALLAFGGAAPAGAERLDSETHWAGAALLPAALVAEVAADLGDWELSGTLVRAAVEAGAGRLIVEEIPTYAPARRRDAPMIWARPQDEAGRAKATESLIAAAQKGCLDWPARFIHPPVENALVRLLMNTPVSPNMVTLFTGVLGFAAIWLFAVGQPMWALALVLIVGPLDGVDGKLARVRHQFSRWGDLEHVLDKVLEYGWFLALAVWLSKSHGLAAWLAAGGIIIFALAEAASGEFFRRFSGRQLDDWGPFERRFRLIGGRRNTFFWTLLPFGLAGAWWPGFLMILAYAAITFAVTQWRFCHAIGAYGRSVSEEVRRNFAGTAYDFLPKADPEAS
ncbi:CDP-alcohol phosphatidyltransferase family protein [Sandaracinobacter sp. RS1-74]|uniref:CDP-alcohol phosphatidyltransferase family protein n=1 Tax=Sandaracinobacteroides sayramensis TaxID=2913411 RepID=UPI001ED9F508|nr:CDP-alcohol phosphatidyltransferase family protein [Sandaracinobacteroides sayramensis]MCG2842377.1 CDP-alcohol phosphatidyltransferase family protein [Sandaracinobacteroides sayramensis]